MTEPIERKLLELAEKARPTFIEAILAGTIQSAVPNVVPLFAACDPDTIARLCRVVEAAREIACSDDKCGCSGTIVYDALRALDGGCRER